MGHLSFHTATGTATGLRCTFGLTFSGGVRSGVRMVLARLFTATAGAIVMAGRGRRVGGEVCCTVGDIESDTASYDLMQRSDLKLGIVELFVSKPFEVFLVDARRDVVEKVGDGQWIVVANAQGRDQDQEPVTISLD